MSVESSEAVFKVVELSLLNAFDLDPPTSKVYVVAWIDPNNRFTSEVIDTLDDLRRNDTKKWLQRFVFIVDEPTMSSITAASVHVELYCADTDAMFGKSTILLGNFGNCGIHYSAKTIGSFREFGVRDLGGNLTRGALLVGVTVLENLPLSNDKLVKTGLAVDFKRLPNATATACGDHKSISSAFKSFVTRFIH